MNPYRFVPLALVAILAGCAGIMNRTELDDPREHDLRVGNIPGSMHPEWKQADRCTKCHMIWSWEFGYYRGWDRHGFISDYTRTIHYGYKDPYGLDAPRNTYAEYYATDWWNGPWLEMANHPEPPMRLDGYGRVNDGAAQPGDFSGKVVVVDPSGKGQARTIQEGVNLAESGSTVFVRRGTYRESVRLKPGIRLWGEDVHKTVIHPDFTGSAIIAANGCDISGFTLTGTGMNYKNYTFNSGIHALDCDSTLVIRGNIFDSNAVHGVLVECSRVGGTPKIPEQRFIPRKDALRNLEYSGYPNPRIIGNTFYHIGERAVYCLHSAPEIANNVFIGNVKTVGMTQHSRPFIHHNVFYRNNVTVNMNRSMPIIRNNVMFRNYWGQRVVEGARPTIHRNVTWNSPWYKEFAEDGSPILYTPIPGTGEDQFDPRYKDPDGGDFTPSADSPLADRSGDLEEIRGLVRAPGIQQPPVLACTRSYAEEFNNRNEASDSMVARIREQNARIRSVRAAYTVEYESFMEVGYAPDGDQETARIHDRPVSGFRYDVSAWSQENGNRRKTYTMTLFAGERTETDAGTVVFENGTLRAPNGRFARTIPVFEDPHHIGEKVFRENTGGICLDYDQYMNGAIGPMGTFYYGYLTLFGGAVQEKRETVDGRECVVVIYPNIGSDLKYRFFLDPEIGYLPRKMEQFVERELWRRVDGYVYEQRGAAHFPTTVVMTDYAVRKPHIGAVIGKTVMRVKPGTLEVKAD